MADIVTDISVNQNWNARKGANNPVTFTFTQNASAFNISTYTFSVQLRKFGSETNLLNLTQGSGITNNGAAGTLNVVFSSANLTNLLANDYYWQMTVVHPDTFSYLWFQGTFKLFSETYTGDLTTSVNEEIDVNGTTINVSITLGVGGSGGGTWGSITGTLSNQTDLQNALNAKADSLTNGNGTTANSTAVDLGGTLTSDATIDGNSGTYKITFNDPLGLSIKNVTSEVFIDPSTVTGQTGSSYFSFSPESILAVDASSNQHFYSRPTFTQIANTLFLYDNASVGRNKIISLTSGGVTSTGLELDATSILIPQPASASSGHELLLRTNGASGQAITKLGIGSGLSISGGNLVSSGGGLTVGTTSITSGTNTRVLYNNSGVLGEYTVSGSGNVAMTTSPTFTTPILGTPTSGTLTNTTGYLFNNLAAATGSNTINNAANAQEWQWNSLGGATAFLISSSSTAAAANSQRLFRVNQTGANATSSQVTYATSFNNTKTGTSAFNIAIEAEASGGLTNYAMYVRGGGINLPDTQFIGWADGMADKGISVTSNVMSISTFAEILFKTYNGSAYVERFRIENANIAATSANENYTLLTANFSPTSGTATMKGHVVSGTINQTGGANGAVSMIEISPTYTAAGGDVHGVYYNPTVTSVTGVNYSFRASSGLMSLPASTTTRSSFRIAHGSAPSSPVDGDIWTTTAGLYVRINGATVGPLT